MIVNLGLVNPWPIQVGDHASCIKSMKSCIWLGQNHGVKSFEHDYIAYSKLVASKLSPFHWHKTIAYYKLIKFNLIWPGQTYSVSVCTLFTFSVAHLPVTHGSFVSSFFDYNLDRTS